MIRKSDRIEDTIDVVLEEILEDMGGHVLQSLADPSVLDPASRVLTPRCISEERIVRATNDGSWTDDELEHVISCPVCLPVALAVGESRLEQELLRCRIRMLDGMESAGIGHRDIISQGLGFGKNRRAERHTGNDYKRGANRQTEA